MLANVNSLHSLSLNNNRLSSLPTSLFADRWERLSIRIICSPIIVIGNHPESCPLQSKPGRAEYPQEPTVGGADCDKSSFQVLFKTFSSRSRCCCCCCCCVSRPPSSFRFLSKLFSFPSFLNLNVFQLEDARPGRQPDRRAEQHQLLCSDQALRAQVIETW